MQLNLTVEIDKDSGFCFGVIEAINKAEEELDKGTELFCLGDIVHNDMEISRLKKRGMKTITKKAFAGIKNKTILFRAHGEPPENYEIAEKNNNKIIDASCPIIKKLQERIKNSYFNNEHIVIYGKQKHPEVIALNGQIKNEGIIIQNIENIDLKKIPVNITLYSQTTQPLDGFHDLVNFLKSNGIEVKVKDTICRQVSNRKIQLEKFCNNYQKIIFIAGKQSSNGKVLYDVCKEINPESYFISNTNDINPEWFKANDKVGITGATSTPNWLMEKVKNYIKEL